MAEIVKKDAENEKQRQQNIDALINAWKARVAKMENEREQVLNRPDVQEALKRLRDRRETHGNTV